MAPDAGAPAADELLRSAIRPSKQLLTLAAKEIRDRERAATGVQPPWRVANTVAR